VTASRINARTFLREAQRKRPPKIEEQGEMIYLIRSERKEKKGKKGGDTDRQRETKQTNGGGMDLDQVNVSLWGTVVIKGTPAEEAPLFCSMVPCIK
jgi:hypothetical protein